MSIHNMIPQISLKNDNATYLIGMIMNDFSHPCSIYVRLLIAFELF